VYNKYIVLLSINNLLKI